MATRIKLRRDTSANWTSVDPILANGEMGIEADTRRVKLGDGATKWSLLKYAITDQLRVDGKTINTEMGVSIASQDPETWVNKVKAKANWAGINGTAYDSKGNLYLSGWEEYGYDGDYENASGKGFLTKFDSQGAVVWSKYIALDSYTNGGGVVVDSEDNIAAITFDWDNNFWVVTKLDSDGVLVWQKTYIDYYISARGVLLAVDSNNDLIVSGTRTDENHGDEQALFVMKIQGLDGSVDWEKTYGGWSVDVWNPCLTVDGSNNIIIGGWGQPYGVQRAYIIKLDTDGDQVWSKTLLNPEGEWDGYDMIVGSLDSDETGNIYFVGTYEVPDLVTDLQGDNWDGRAGQMIKFNSSGEVQWSRLVGPGDCEDMGAQIAYKEGKVYALVQTEKRYYKNDIYTNIIEGYTTQEIAIACFDADNGKVLWANNFGPEVLWGYAAASADPSNYQDTTTWQGRYIAIHGDYIAVAGQSGEYSRTDNTETRSYGWLAQLPKDGTLMDLEGWSFTTNKTPGKYAQIKTENWSDLDGNSGENIDITGSSEYIPVDTDDNFNIELIASGSNTWDFKPNGDLALPVGGNIELSRALQGDINVIGYFDSDNNNSIHNFFRSVTTDSEGNKYYAGMWNANSNWTPQGNRQLPLVVKVNKDGQVEWKVRLSNTYLYGSDSVSGSANSIAYDPATGNVVVVCSDSGEGNAEQMLVVDLDATNGKVLYSKRFRDDNEEDLRGFHININNDGERFIAGTVFGGDIYFSVNNSMVAPGNNDTLMISKTFFGDNESPSSVKPYNWQIYIDDYWHSVMDIDYYTNISGTVLEGSGAEFTITDNGDTSYTVTTVSNGGTDYKVGHKIKILGTSLGGTTPTNDAIITVDSISGSAIDTASVTGTAAGGSPTPYSGVSGANHNVGSGFTIDVQVNSDTGYLEVYHNTGGTNYVVGDVITFPGTSLGGTSPATDLVITALQVGLVTGDVQSTEDVGYSVTSRGTSPLTMVRMRFYDNPDFSTGGPWNLLHYTNANAVLAKLNPPTATTATNWVKWIDKADTDLGIASDYDNDGNIYWLAQTYDERNLGGGSEWDNRPAVIKLNSDGDLQWMKTYSWDGNEGNAFGIQVDSEDKVVIAHQKWVNYSYEWHPIVQRLLPNGNVLWTKKFSLDGGEGEAGGIGLDNDDNIYYTGNRYNDQDGVVWTTKLDIQNGDVIWQQEISNEGRDLSLSYWGQNYIGQRIAVDSKHYHIAGETWDLDGNEGLALAATLPSDGSAGNVAAGPFQIDETFYGTEGSGDSPVTRNHNAPDWPGFIQVTNRDPIISWTETGPTSFYPVYTKGDAGIKFADGTVQTTSGTGIPQIRRNAYDKQYTLKLSDAGKHLYMRNNEGRIVLPPYSRVPFEVGSVITVINMSGGTIYIGMDTTTLYRGRFYIPQTDGYEGSNPYSISGVSCDDNGGGQIITMLKVAESYSDGSVWMISCAGGVINTWTY